MANGKIKNLGQVYTPEHIVNDMLDLVGYNGATILRKHIIDNSCGNGAFLTEIVERYCTAYERTFGTLNGVVKELETYIHGVEIDSKEFNDCLTNLDRVLSWKGIYGAEWNIINGDTLEQTQFDKKMDFVVANPPYVRIHNLAENFIKVRNYEFAKNGMTDLFIVFYDIGFRMLNGNGKLVYITPNSFYSSVAGDEFRHYIISNKNLYAIYDLGHYQPFQATAYTTVCAFDLSKKFEYFAYSTYDKSGKVRFQENLKLEEAFNNGKMILAKEREQGILKTIQNYIPANKDLIQVKNAFATLGDGIFIKDDFKWTDKYIIDILKASTGEWKKCIFPYSANGKKISFNELEPKTREYLLSQRERLRERSLDKKTEWYEFGRSQALNDINKYKIAVNTTIKDINSIKINEVMPGCGIYSGLYILTDIPIDRIKSTLLHQDFIDCIATIGKCKSGGYYTFSSSDLKQYLLYKLEGEKTYEQCRILECS
jgi:adenine-specific DNA-methyltransferase